MQKKSSFQILPKFLCHLSVNECIFENERLWISYTPAYICMTGYMNRTSAYIIVFLACCGLLLSGLYGCGSREQEADAVPVESREHFFHLLEMGDSIYAQKKDFYTFSNSLRFYDSAQVIADHSKDTRLKAEALFAKGRIYDAWNKEPQQTIKYFTDAANLFEQLPDQYPRYLYVTQLVAHAYDKIGDSTHTVQTLRKLWKMLYKADSTFRKQQGYIAQMALISTEVHNYVLADSILNFLYKREWIHNDPETYNYLDNYYLTRARIEVYHEQVLHPVYLDSLEQAYRRTNTDFDKAYLAANLSKLYARARDTLKAYTYLQAEYELVSGFNQERAVSVLEHSLMRSELDAEKRQIEYEQTMQRWKGWGFLTFMIGFLAIAILSIFLYKNGQKYRALSGKLALTNEHLDQQIENVELLHKEMQHRVKNNLLMIISLLQMQERKSRNEEVIEDLREARLRVESIAELHLRLSSSEQHIDFKTFITRLAHAIAQCFTNGKPLEVQVQGAEEIHLPKRQHLPLTLILNEWMINSIKYAQTADPLLRLTITFRVFEHELEISYRDNGQASGHATDPSSGLGTEIISLLCKQLHARLSRNTENPYHYTIVCPYGKQN